MSLVNIITEINENIPECAYGRLYGLAQTVIRTRGEKFEFLPGIVADGGDIEYVGLDDDEPIIIYHKMLGIGCKTLPGTGNDYDIVNTFNNCMIVFNDRSKSQMRTDELLALIQSNIPSLLKVPPYRTVKMAFSNVAVDDMKVFESEYQNTEFRLPANKNLFQINYIIESTFNKKCFDKCS